MATWRELLTEVMAYNKDTFADIEVSTLTREQLDVEFNNDYGRAEGTPFTVWTKNKVYFPIVYDGAEWVGSVSRNPDGKATAHVGRE